MEIELKPCTFCAHKQVAVKNRQPDWWWVECGGCEARGPLAVREGLARLGWNLRAEMGNLLNSNRILEERVEQLSKGLRGIATDYAAEYPTIAKRARRTLEENNEGDVPSPDGDAPSEGQAGTS